MSQLPLEPAAAEPHEANSSIQRRVYLLLRDMIEDGRIAPGEKLLEAQVAKSFGISRSPARIALAALCAEKRVVEGEGRGYRVAGKPSRARGADGAGATVGRAATLAASRMTKVESRCHAVRRSDSDQRRDTGVGGASSVVTFGDMLGKPRGAGVHGAPAAAGATLRLWGPHPSSST